MNIHYTIPQLQKIYLNQLGNLHFTGEPQNLYDPVNYILTLGGKRIRPVLALIGCQLFGEDPLKALPVANAVEIFHNFSLVHDDIMDQAAIRRGKPTVHEKWGMNTAILSGDVMLVQAYIELGKAENPALYSVFNKIAVEVCEGQQMDMNFETASKVSVGQYIRMIELKTAALLGGSLEMGAIVAHTHQENIRRIDQIGRNLGIAFQLQDDYLDTFGDPEKFGKKIGGDILQQKKTYLMLNALNLANGRDLIDLTLTHYPDPDEKIARITSIYESLGVKENTRQMMHSFKEKAFKDIERLECELYGKEMLFELTDLLMGRES
jgi:geranylgeranyl diphosphate synthase, type II